MSGRSVIASLRRRAANVADALTQLLNGLLLARPYDTNANESVSGRCYREAVLEQRGGAWSMARTVIDTFFDMCFGQNEHCFGAYMTDLSRGDAYRERHSRYINDDA